MNKNIIEGNWNELKGKIRTKWAKFTDQDLEHVKGGYEQLKGKLQKTYGYSQDESEREAAEFRKEFEPGGENINKELI